MLYAQDSFAHTKDIFEWDICPSAVKVKGRYTLDDLKSLLNNPENGLPTIGIPVIFTYDEIQSGSMFSKSVETCLVLKNAQHQQDYFHFVFTARQTGNMTYFEIYRSGTSPRSYDSNKKDEWKASNSLFKNILGAVAKTDERGIREEYDYYDMVADIIKECLGVN